MVGGVLASVVDQGGLLDQLNYELAGGAGETDQKILAARCAKVIEDTMANLMATTYEDSGFQAGAPYIRSSLLRPKPAKAPKTFDLAKVINRLTVTYPVL